MLTFNNDSTKKWDRIKRAKQHVMQDRLIRGSYSNYADQGCSVGCDVYDITGSKPKTGRDLHAIVAVNDGMPIWFEHVRDCVFEGLSHEDASAWHLDLAEAIPVGVHLERQCRMLLAWLFDPTGLLKDLLVSNEDKLIRAAIDLTYKTLTLNVNSSSLNANKAKQALFELDKTTKRLPKSSLWRRKEAKIKLRSLWALEAASRACTLTILMETGDIDGRTLQHTISGVCRAACDDGSKKTNAEIYSKVAEKFLSLISDPRHLRS